jgi:hypothetical protein
MGNEKRRSMRLALAAIFLFSSFSIGNGLCDDLPDIKALDEKVRTFLESRPDFKTTIDTTSSAGISISCKTADK